MLAKSDIRREALNLPAQERVELVVELWNSPAPGEIPDVAETESYSRADR